MSRNWVWVIALIISSTLHLHLSAQYTPERNERIEEFTTSKINKKRLTWSLITSGTVYTVSSITLYEAWYKDFPQSSFHFYNDFDEWRGVDKAGHMFSGYFQADWAYKGWRWTGLEKDQAMWAGAATSLLAQTTIEVLDGFSREWGFSIPDFTANVIGTSSFVVQQKLWGDQRIRFKTSSSPINYQERYGDEAFSARASELYGDGFFTRYLKDYNAQTTWLSVNLNSFAPKSHLPKWLNVAVGYGADNLFGGFTNQVPTISSDQELRRYSQIFISFDADLSKIDTGSPFVRTVLDILNVFKVPFSTIEINTLGEVKFYAIRF